MFLCQNLVSSSNWIYLFMMSAKGWSFSFMRWCKDSAKCTIIYQTLRIKLGTYIFCRLALKLDLLNVSGVNWIGLYTKYLTERAQRKAFLETRRSLEMRFKTQKENERQERLLLSVLPSFVAQQMIRDIGSLRIWSPNILVPKLFDPQTFFGPDRNRPLSSVVLVRNAKNINFPTEPLVVWLWHLKANEGIIPKFEWHGLLAIRIN